jgi:hypothetical protein
MESHRSFRIDRCGSVFGFQEIGFRQRDQSIPNDLQECLPHDL